jgi:phospholipid/cholesterol/gamma-HCH transport system substrate-binding protein
VKISKEFKVGFLFLLAVGLFIWGFNFLKGTDFFKQSRILYAVYNQVEGLEPANKVKISGLNIGHVNRLGFIPGTSQIIAELYIKSDIPIPDNSVARLYSTDLLGGKAIEIILGDSEQYTSSGDTLTSDLEQTLREQVNDQVEPLRRKAIALINSVDSLLMSVQSIVVETKQLKISESFDNIKKAIYNLENATSTLDTILDKEKTRINNIMTNLESITHNLEKNNTNINNIFENISSISDSLAVAEIPQTIREAKEAMINLKEISDKINRGEGTIGQLMTNDSLYFQMEKSTESLNKLLEDLRLNPKRYVRFSLF